MAKETKNKFRFWSNKEKRFVEPYRIKFLRCGRISSNYDLEISQSTGILDQNGIEIFEGDILRYGGENGMTIEVQWNEYDDQQGFNIDTDEWEREIVGNIYEK